MLKALWYLVQILALVGFVVFLLVQPGEVHIAWKDYTISVQLGFAGVALLALVIFVSLFTEMLTRISLWPKNLARSRAERRRTKGYRALMQSLSCAATGDQKNAYYLAVRAQNFLPEAESGLPLLLQAQAMSWDGAPNIDKQADPYQLLLKNADTALLGLQGLTQNAILAGDFGKALLLARKAFQENPRNVSLLKAVYDLEIRNRLWNDALVTLDKADRAAVIPRGVAEHDRTAIFLALGDMALQENRTDEAYKLYKKAYKLDHEFVPAAVRYIQSHLDSGQRRSAVGLLETVWKIAPHPAFIPLWRAAMPAQKVGQPNVKFRWFQWISEFHPESDIGQLALARVAIEDGMWGEARSALARAEKLSQSAEIYELWVMLEERTDNRPDVIRQWLDRAYKAPASGTWVCTKSGRHFSEWQAVVEPEGHFNSLVWSHGGVAPQNTAVLLNDASNGAAAVLTQAS